MQKKIIMIVKKTSNIICKNDAFTQTEDLLL